MTGSAGRMGAVGLPTVRASFSVESIGGIAA